MRIRITRFEMRDVKNPDTSTGGWSIYDKTFKIDDDIREMHSQIFNICQSLTRDGEKVHFHFGDPIPIHRKMSGYFTAYRCMTRYGRIGSLTTFSISIKKND